MSANPEECGLVPFGTADRGRGNGHSAFEPRLIIALLRNFTREKWIRAEARASICIAREFDVIDKYPINPPAELRAALERPGCLGVEKYPGSDK